VEHFDFGNDQQRAAISGKTEEKASLHSRLDRFRPDADRIDGRQSSILWIRKAAVMKKARYARPLLSLPRSHFGKWRRLLAGRSCSREPRMALASSMDLWLSDLCGARVAVGRSR
jgi:hypothetical protein